MKIHVPRLVRPVLLLLATASFTTEAVHAAEAFPDSGLTEPSGPLSKAIPSGAVAYIEVAGLGSVVDRIQHSSLLQMAISSPQFQGLEKTPQYRKIKAGRQIAEAQLGMDLWTLAEELFRDRLAVALYLPPDGNPQPGTLALLRGVDPKVLLQLRQRLEPFLTLMDEQIELSDTPTGAKVVSVNGKAYVALGNSWIAFANTRELLMKSLGLISGKSQGALADDVVFQVSTTELGDGHLASAFLNLELLTKAKGGRLTPDKLDNPLASMFFGGALELAAGSPYVGLSLDVEENRFVLKSAVAGDSRTLDEAHRVFFSDPSGSGTADIPKLPGIIGGFTFYLDFANWYRQREKLLQAQVLPGFDQFETGIGNLLPGKDVGEDVVPLIGKSVTFVAAPQDYSHLDGRPGVKLPGFALVVDLARPEEGGDIFQLFFQTLSSILNLQAREQNRQPWIMGSETYANVQISYGRYLEKPKGDQLPLVFNFMPASARVGNKFIVSSSLGLCRHLIEAIQAPPADVQRPNRNLNFELHVEALADILQANQEMFQARAIQEGKEALQAATEFSALLGALRHFDSLQLTTTVKAESYQVRVEGSWK